MHNRIAVGDTHLHYERTGRGEVLLLVHGGGGDSRYWDGQFAALAQSFDVLRYDLRGYGRSDAPVPGQPYRHEDDLRELLRVLDLSSVHVAGFSLGSQVMVDAYTLYPDCFRSMTAIGPYVSGYQSPAGDALFGGYAACGQAFLEQGAEPAAERFASIPAFNPDRIDPQVRAAVAGICRDYRWWWAAQEDPLVHVEPAGVVGLEQIQVPMLTITAEYDAAVCREVADLLARRVPTHRLVDLPDASHFMLMEQPEAVNRLLKDFLLSE